MPKRRERNETEYLRGLVRELKSEVRHLKKYARKSDKRLKQYEQIIDEQEESALTDMEAEYVYVKTKERCPDCKGELEVIDLQVKDLYLCDCGYRRTLSKKASSSRS